MNYLPRMLQMLKKIRYFYSLFSENLRLAQNLPNEVFLTISDFKVDIPYTEILRISLTIPGLHSEKESRPCQTADLYLILKLFSKCRSFCF